MGKRKRGIGCKENESTSVDSGYSEDPIQGGEWKRQCLPGDVDMPDLADSIMVTSPQLFEQIECVNNNDELPTPAASDARPTLQLRTSVRVQNKRKEENRSEHSSESLIKRGDICSQDEEEDDNAAKPECTDGEGKKRRRAWEVWSMEDKNVFFEGINECGKDFEAIQNFLMNKMRRKGNINYVTKKKEQVRHFYYRTWHKISKYVSFDTDARKATQELYGLINYGELRRKIGGTLDEKKGQKLQELIQKGTTSWRIKGKNIRVRTPICRALKKLNEFTDDRDHGCFRVPTFVTLTLSAGNIESFSHVQSVAHNPRVRIQCPLYKQLSSLFSLFERKWRSQEVKMCERLATSLALPVDIPTPSPLTMRLRPVLDAEINIAHIEPDTQMTSSAVSLSSHEQYLKKNMLTNLICSHRKARKRKTLSDHGKCAEGDDQPLVVDVDSQDDGSDTELECGHKSPPSDLIIISSDSGSSQQEYDTLVVKTEPVRSPSPVTGDADLYDVPAVGDEIVVKEENDALRQLKALQNVVNPHEDADDEVVFVAENTRLLGQIRDQAAKTHDEIEPCVVTVSDEEEPPTIHIEKPETESPPKSEEQIRKGWTSSTCGSIMIGELYLMFGKKKTLALEYVFEDANNAVVNSQVDSTTGLEPNPEAETTDSQEPSAETTTINSEIILESVEKFENEDSKTAAEGCPLSDSSPTPADSLSEKESARKEFSNVLERLLTMVKCFVAKPLAGPADCLLCGNSSSKPSATARSPANSRNSAYGRSPGHARSPRVPSSSKSPKNSSVNSKSSEDKAKPSSAKRLLTSIPEENEEKCVPTIPQTDPPAVLRPTEQPLLPKPSTESTGGFRVPLAPAPRVASSHSVFNAQLSKLLPKYSRPRRTPRKNIFVQRQLPLLPTTAKKSQGFITLKILPQPGDASSSQSRCLPPPILPIQVIPMSAPPCSSPESSAAISMPIISAIGHQSSVPNPTPISVNVSGQQLLTVQMPALRPQSTANAVSSPSHIMTCDSFPPIAVVASTSSVQMNALPVPVSAFKTELADTDVKIANVNAIEIEKYEEPNAINTKISADFDVANILSKQSVYSDYPPVLPTTPLHQSAFLLEDNKPELDQATCSTPMLPELKDISFLELTPFNSPAKSKFSLSPLNCLNDSSNMSLLTSSSKSSEAKTISAIKLNLASVLNATNFTGLEQEASGSDNGALVTEFHIPESNDNLPLLDVSVGGTLSIRTQGHSLNMASSLPKTEPEDEDKEVVGDKRKLFPPNTPTKMMDITLANSNSNSCFSTLLAAATGHATIETESCDTLQTPPRSTKSQQQSASVTKKDPNAPFGLTFKANLFAGDCSSSVPTQPTTTPSPPTSPSRLLLQADQWLNNETNDFSLSTLLSHLESPVKSVTNSQKPTAKDDSCSLTSFLTDNSVDYTVTFAKFKAQIAKDNRQE